MQETSTLGEDMLRQHPELEAKALSSIWNQPPLGAVRMKKGPRGWQEKHLRAFQRRAKGRRLTNGPPKGAFFTSVPADLERLR